MNNKHVNTDNMEYALSNALHRLIGMTPSQQSSYSRNFKRGYMKAYADTANNTKQIRMKTDTIARMAYKAGYEAGLDSALNLSNGNHRISDRNVYIRAGKYDSRFSPEQESAYSRLGLM